MDKKGKENFYHTNDIYEENEDLEGTNSKLSIDNYSLRQNPKHTMKFLENVTLTISTTRQIQNYTKPNGEVQQYQLVPPTRKSEYTDDEYEVAKTITYLLNPSPMIVYKNEENMPICTKGESQHNAMNVGHKVISSKIIDKERFKKKKIVSTGMKNFQCKWCSRSFFSGPALGGHKKTCNKKEGRLQYLFEANVNQEFIHSRPYTNSHKTLAKIPNSLSKHMSEGFNMQNLDLCVEKTPFLESMEI